jgi:hypothetical protein
MATLTRQDMERIIVEERGSVLHGGRIISRVEDLPKESDLAGSDPEQRASVRAHLEARRAALDAELTALDDATPTPPVAAGATASTPPPPPPPNGDATPPSEETPPQDEPPPDNAPKAKGK